MKVICSLLLVGSCNAFLPPNVVEVQRSTTTLSTCRSMTRHESGADDRRAFLTKVGQEFISRCCLVEPLRHLNRPCHET
jgi:hypothetical protein